MEKAKKLTKRDLFNRLLTLEEVTSDSELVNFINHELELLDKKANRTAGGQTANQKANEEIKTQVLEALRAIGKTTISGLQKDNAEMAQYSNQKLSALLKQMVEAGLVERSKDKKATLFEAIDTEE